MHLERNSIIPIYTNEEKEHLINARELHEKLDVQTRFDVWIKRKIEYAQLNEGIDFIFLLKIEQKSKGRPQQEYMLSMDAAKHIAMLERTSRGKEIRQYFIEVEKISRKHLLELASINKRVENLENKINSLSQKQNFRTRAKKYLGKATDPKILFDFFLQNTGKKYNKTDLRKQKFVSKNKFASWFNESQPTIRKMAKENGFNFYHKNDRGNLSYFWLEREEK
jgi:anti-repressor protein